MSLPPRNQRVRILIEKYAFNNVKKFSERARLPSSQNLNRIFNKERRTGKYPSVSTAMITSILNTFPDISTDWLLLGKGEMISGTPEEKTQHETIEALEIENNTLRQTIEMQKEKVELLKQTIETQKHDIDFLREIFKELKI